MLELFSHPAKQGLLDADQSLTQIPAGEDASSLSAIILDDKRLKKPAMRWKQVPGTDNRLLVHYDQKEYSAYGAALKKHWQLEEELNRRPPLQRRVHP